MDDIVIAQSKHPDRPPYASSFHPSATGASPAAVPGTPQQATGAMQLMVDKLVDDGGVATSTQAEASDRGAAAPQASERFTILVLKSNQEIEVTKFRRDADLLMFQDTQGRKGSVDVGDVDWRKTSEMTEQVRSVDTGTAALQVN